MAYTPTIWESSVTALSAQNMNHIESGIQEAHQKLEPTALASALIDIIYPVGWLIETTDESFNPNTALGGEWELLGEGQVIISAGPNYQAGSQYGSNTHTLTEAELPKISGSIGIRKYSTSSGSIGATAHNASGHFSTEDGSSSTSFLKGNTSANGATKVTYAFGNGEAHSIMQKSTAAYIWHRTA